jgi:hypothetical protein
MNTIMVAAAAAAAVSLAAAQSVVPQWPGVCNRTYLSQDAFAKLNTFDEDNQACINTFIACLANPNDVGRPAWSTDRPHQ